MAAGRPRHSVLAHIMRSGLFILKIALVSTAENIHMASTNKIAVLGGGSVGSTLAKALADADEDVVIAARDPARTAENLAWRNVSGLRVEPVADALGSASVIILATPSVRDDAGIRALAASLGDVSGKVVIDATNPLGSFGESLNVRWGGDGTSGGEVLASALPGARVYKRPQTRSASSTCGPPWGRT